MSGVPSQLARIVALAAIAPAACGRVHFERLTDASDEGPCPEDFVLVAGNAALGTGEFCVMRFEAKARGIADGVIEPNGCDALCTSNSLIDTHEPAGVPEGRPWRLLDPVQAQLRCQARGAGFDLLSNREWMTLARDAERVAANWSGAMPGVGRMVEGNTDEIPSYSAVTDPSDPYSDTGNSAADAPGAGWEQRRTLALSSGRTIWDLPGNVQEWVDWTLGGVVDGAPTPCTSAELPAFACAGVMNDDFNSSTGTYDSTNGVGRVIGGAGNATRRGGQAGDLSMGIAGAYALNMNRFVTDTFNGTGFRCVLRLAR